MGRVQDGVYKSHYNQIDLSTINHSLFLRIHAIWHQQNVCKTLVHIVVINGIHAAKNIYLLNAQYVKKEAYPRQEREVLWLLY